MRFVFKTDYDIDLRLLKYRSDAVSYGVLLLALIAAPWVMQEYYVGELAQIFVLCIASVGLMMLSGFTGLVSLGHAAFIGIGAYAHTLLLTAGVPWIVSLAAAGALTALIGLLLGIPALRMTGLYLAFATLAFSVLVEHVLGNWDSLTNGHTGIPVPSIDLFGIAMAMPRGFYYVCLVVLIGVLLVAANILRSSTGRAMIAIRDSEVAAQSLGVNLAFTKSVAFAISAGMTGLAGGLYAHKINYLTPEAFNVLLSLQLLLMVVVGGLGSLKGAIYGAIFVGALPQAISILKGYLPDSFASRAGLEITVFGLVLVGFVLFEPLGLAGRWAKMKAFFQTFPLYRRAMFRRGKAYMKSERYR